MNTINYIYYMTACHNSILIGQIEGNVTLYCPLVIARAIARAYSDVEVI